MAFIPGGDFRVTVDTSQLEKLAKDIGKYEPMLRADLRTDVDHTILHGLAIAKDKAPKFLAILAGSIRPRMATVKPQFGAGVEISGDIHTGPYIRAIVQEHGRRPLQKAPPVSAIERWVHLKHARGQFNVKRYKGETQKAAERRIAFAVAKSIGFKGTPGHKYMTQAQKAMIRVFNLRVEKTVAKWIDRISRGP